MVGGQGDLHHRANHDLVVAHDGLLERGRNREDGGFARVDDGGEILHVQHAHVRDGEGAARHVVGCEFAGARLVGQGFRLGVELSHAQFVRAADDRHDQPLFQRDGQAEVDAAVPAHALAVGGAIDGGELLQAQHHGLRDEIGDGERRALFFEPGAELNQVGHVHLDSDEEMGGGDDALGEALRDDLAHLAHRLGSFRQRPLHIRHRDPARVTGAFQGQQVEFFLGRKLLRSRRDADARVTLGLQIRPHVLLHHASFRSRTADRRRVNDTVRRQPRRARADRETTWARRAWPPAAPGRARRRPVARRRWFGLASMPVPAAGAGASVLRGVGEGAGKATSGTASPVWPRNPTGLCTGTLTPGWTRIFSSVPASKLSTSMTDLSVSTVNRMSPFGDGVAFLFQPFDDGALLGHLPELGHDDRRSHRQPYRMALAASRISATFGRNAASRMCDCGAMPLRAPTRLTGASR